MSRPQILMCPPDFYGIEYEINPWMNRARQADPAEARRQWQALHDLLLRCGAEIALLDPVPGLPDLVFTANAALIYRQQVVLANFRHVERQRETIVDETWFRGHGFEILALPTERFFEGAGDALFCGESLFAGYRKRSDALGLQQLGARLNVQVLPLELVDSYYYHLDTCFCPLKSGEAIYYPAAFDDYGRRVLRNAVPELLPVAESEARRFACNAVVVGRNVITNTGCPQLHDALRTRGYVPWETPLEEFVKAGGSAKCLTLRLDGEEAAAWKTLPLEAAG